MNNYNIIQSSQESIVFNLPDLAENGTAWSLFKLKINQQNIANEEIEVLRCNISYTDIDGNSKNKGPVKIVLKPVNENAFAAIAENEKKLGLEQEQKLTLLDFKNKLVKQLELGTGL